MERIVMGRKKDTLTYADEADEAQMPPTTLLDLIDQIDGEVLRAESSLADIGEHIFGPCPVANTEKGPPRTMPEKLSELNKRLAALSDELLRLRRTISG